MARLEVEHSLDAVFRAIASIQDPVLREVMFDFIEKMTLRESAARHKLSPSTIFRLRRKGLLQVRRFVREELAAAVH
jgi:hypothetical protein